MQWHALLPQLRVFGIGIATEHLCLPTVHSGDAHIVTRKNVQLGQVLAVLPDSALWCVNTCMDSDTKSGFLPDPSELARLIDTQLDLLDELYIACCLAVRCFMAPTCWFSQRVNAIRLGTAMPLTDQFNCHGVCSIIQDTDGMRMCALHSRLGETFATPPLSYWLAARHYVQAHALQRNSAASGLRPLTCVAPLLDYLVRPHARYKKHCSAADEAGPITRVDSDKPNTRLMSTCVQDVRQLLRHERTLSDLRGARQYLRGKEDKYRYWLLCAERDIREGEVLCMSPAVACCCEDADAEAVEQGAQR